VEEGGSFFGLGFADGALGVEDFGGDAFCGEEFPGVFLGWVAGVLDGALLLRQVPAL
jgi:hypothetical protein